MKLKGCEVSLFSDLNLNGRTPVRVQPGQEWGPERVPSVKQKKRARLYTVLAFVGALGAVGFAIKFFFDVLMQA